MSPPSMPVVTDAPRRPGRAALAALAALAACAVPPTTFTGEDAGVPDAAPPDTGAPDAAVPDAAPPDTGAPDAAVPDAAPPDALPPDALPPDALPPDATPAPGLAVAAAPGALVFHVGDVRRLVVTVRNPGTAPTDGPAAVALVGLVAAEATVDSSTCTAALPPGGSCAVAYTVTAVAQTAGEAFAAEATAPTDLVASVALAATVLPACPATCGLDGAANCCDSEVVPGNAPGATLAGEPFYRSFDYALDDLDTLDFPATVSDVRLDVYEVTVARFRAFVDAGLGTQALPPAPGAGARATLPGSGWDPAWNASLAPNTGALQLVLSCAASYPVWSTTPGAHDVRPMNCVTWYEAMAFCAWDGGFLPTEAEWNYAAAGGSDQRAFPWSAPASSTAIDEAHASYNAGTAMAPLCRGDGVDACGVTDLLRPGSKPAGDGRWRHADLAGNVREWVLDWQDAAYEFTTCADCAGLTVPGGATPGRVARGGAFLQLPSVLRTTSRGTAIAPSERRASIGFRCARPR